MRKGIAIIFFILLFLVSGCSSEQRQEKSAVNNAQQIQPTETKNLKANEAGNTFTQPEKTYQPTKARSKQKVVATFEVGSNRCIIDGKPVTMEAAVMEKQYQIYVPAQYFTQAIGVLSGDMKVEQVNSNHKDIQLTKVSLKYNNIFIAGVGPDIRLGEKSYHYYTLATMAYLDSAGIPYLSLRPFAKATGYDMYWDKSTGKVELLAGLLLEERDFVIAQVKTGLKEKEVIQILGQPNTIDGPRRGGIDDFKSLLYPGLKIRTENYDDWIVAVIELNDTRYKTVRGIAVEDSIQKVIDQYGLGYYFDEKANEYHYRVLTSYFQRKEVIFKIENEIVKEIRIIDVEVS